MTDVIVLPPEVVEVTVSLVGDAVVLTLPPTVEVTVTVDAMGPEGPEGPAGPPGEGVPTGGAAGEALVKASGADFDTDWVALTAADVGADPAGAAAAAQAAAIAASDPVGSAAAAQAASDPVGSAAAAQAAAQAASDPVGSAAAAQAAAIAASAQRASNLSDLANGATAFANIKQAATTSATGVVELATSAETQAVTDTSRAVTPAGAAATYQPAPTFAMTTFSVNQGAWLASHPPFQGAAVVSTATATGRSFWVPIWLAAGTYDRIGVYVFTIGTATWRLGLDNCPMNTATPTANLLDAGTLNMAAGTGMQSIIINHAVATSGWFYARMLVTAYTSNPSVAMHNQNAFDSRPPFQGWPANDFNSNRGYCGFFYYGGGTGAFGAIPAITPGNPNTGLAFSEQAPKIFLRRAS